MLPLQAGGWGCFIGVSSVGKGREGSGQSSPPSKWSGAAQNSKCQCSEQPFCTRPPAAILDCSAVSRLYTAPAAILDCSAVSRLHTAPAAILDCSAVSRLYTASSRHLGLQCRDLPLCTRPPAAILDWSSVSRLCTRPPASILEFETT